MNVPAGGLEWLETSKSGSFALGCVDRKLRRKYHALLTVREPGRGDAWNVIADLRETLVSSDQTALLCDPISGRGEQSELVDFSAYPSATHRYRALDLTIERTVRFGEPDQVEVRYRVSGVHTPVELRLEPLLRCREVHKLTFENPFLDGAMTWVDGCVRMHPYAGMPEVVFRVDGASQLPELAPSGRWFTQVDYEWEAARGYDAREDLFSPGALRVSLEQDAELTLVIGLDRLSPARSETAGAVGVRGEAPPRLSFAQKLKRAAGQYWMQTRAGDTSVVAGYPWFGAWGRDTLIALPGMYLATEDFERTEAALETLVKARIRGLIPNIPALGGNAADTCSVDASLLFVRTVQWLARQVGSDRVERFMPAVCELLEALADASDPRMRFDHGVGVWTEPGPWALTWMDAMVNGEPVTPRAGYAIEIDALAYNAVRFALSWAEARKGSFAKSFRTRLRSAEADFVRRYWDDSRGYLADGHDGKRPEPKLRPNQLFACGLPHRPISASMARASLEAVTRALLIPAGLRTLSPFDPSYRGHYGGTQLERDMSYHQGTAWPWLVGVYADAVHATLGRAALEVRLSPVFSFMAHHLDEEGCIGQVAEVFAGNRPYVWNGTPAQAWSVTELYRALRLLQDGGTA